MLRLFFVLFSDLFDEMEGIQLFINTLFWFKMKVNSIIEYIHVFTRKDEDGELATLMLTLKKRPNFDDITFIYIAAAC